ncbi:sigma 54-interacting transcriptional regulator [Clostridium carnis]
MSSYSCKGITTQQLANELGISRANISNELNKLYEIGKVRKSNGRPVLYFPVIEEKKDIMKSDYIKAVDSSLDNFIKLNPSLRGVINQGKAAILYPPEGMNMLILGETGVGKSMFAELVHRYSIEVKRIRKNAPFIVFNCADYVNNPQLLLSQLFGIKKGAYTGANEDKPGLIEKANNGILFLDEVHRLPSEGQEMLFVFLDQGKFRRLGETEFDRKAKVLIICATTEDPNSTLLNTFTRRIPMTIRIPNLKERGYKERLNLIINFFKEESFKFKQDIKISINSLKAFLKYPCSNNIGQLRADIQLVSAKVYADFLTEKKGSIKINSCDLPKYIEDYINVSSNIDEIINNMNIDSKYITINQEEDIKLLNQDNINDNIYELIINKVHELRDAKNSEVDFTKIIYNEFNEYFNKYIPYVNEYDKNMLGSLIDESIIGLLNNIKDLVYKKLNKKISKNTSIGIMLYLNTAINQLAYNKRVMNPQLLYIRTKYRVEFETALEIIKLIEEKLDRTLSIDDAGYITLFLTRNDKGSLESNNRVGVIVLCHGDSTATSMAKVANDILEEKYAIGINLPLNKSRVEILQLLREYIKNDYKEEGYLFLVDMGSLVSIGTILEEEFNIKSRQINNVSTIHVIEATRKAIMGEKLEDIYNSLSRDENIKYIIKDNKEKRKYSIVTACLTGEGSASIMAKYLKGRLRYNKNIFEIIPLSINNKNEFNQSIKNIELESEIICIVSSLKLSLDIPQYTLDEMLSLKAISKIQDIIDIKYTYEELKETFKEHIKNTDGEILYNDVVNLLFSFQKSTNKILSTELFIPMALHIACMVDRLLKEDVNVEFKESNEYKNNNIEMYNLVVKELEIISNKYNIHITQDEYCYITEFFLEI